MSGSRKIWAQALLPAVLGAALLAVSGCAPRGSGPAAVGPLAPGQARIWFYRDYVPSGSLNYARIELSGLGPVYVKADGSSTYRDVPPGQYEVKADSVGSTGRQAQPITVGPGDEDYVKIESLDQWMESGDMSSFRRDTFEVALVPPQIARVQIAAHPFSSGP